MFRVNTMLVIDFRVRTNKSPLFYDSIIFLNICDFCYNVLYKEMKEVYTLTVPY